MQLTRCNGLWRGLSSSINRYCCSMTTRPSVTPHKMTPTYSSKMYHSPPRCTNTTSFRQNFSRKQQGVLQQNRWTSSHTAGDNPSHDKSDEITSADAVSDDSEAASKYKTLREELKQMRDIGRVVPEEISDADLHHYANLSSKSAKGKFLAFLLKKQNVKKKEKLKKIQRRLEREKSRDDEEDIDATLPPNKLLRRLSNTSVVNSDNWRLASGMQFGPQIAYDFSFDSHMVRREVLSMVKQLTHVINANKLAKDPFYIHWTGLKEGDMTLREMKRMFSDHYENMMVNTTEKDVLEIFPKEKLIYLTADSRNILHTFDVDKVYIVGGFVDAQSVKTGVTLAKAKRHNISHARLPLDLYLQWEAGSKTLTLDQVARILHTLHETGDWVKALANVPVRKHGGYKMSQNIASHVLRKIESRQGLEQLVEGTEKRVKMGRARKETVIRDGSRFSFSRANREFKWDLISNTDRQHAQGGQSGRSRTGDVTESLHGVEQSEDNDLPGETLLSFSGDRHHLPGKRTRKSGAKWFED